VAFSDMLRTRHGRNGKGVSKKGLAQRREEASRLGFTQAGRTCRSTSLQLDLFAYQSADLPKQYTQESRSA